MGLLCGLGKSAFLNPATYLPRESTRILPENTAHDVRLTSWVPRNCLQQLSASGTTMHGVIGILGLHGVGQHPSPPAPTTPFVHATQPSQHSGISLLQTAETCSRSPSRITLSSISCGRLADNVAFTSKTLLELSHSGALNEITSFENVQGPSVCMDLLCGAEAARRALHTCCPMIVCVPHAR